jgi:hypothetical protein
LHRTTVPSNVNTVHTPNASWETSCRVLSHDVSIRRFVEWHVYIALL